jgi:hypothetical protein
MRTVLLFVLFLAASVAAQDLQLGVIYTCSGERLYLESCNIRDLSDTATCQVAHPDRPKHNGFMAYTSETRGALKQLLPSCQQPPAAEVAKAQAHYKQQNDIVAANQKKANDEADAIEARARAVPGQKTQTPEQRAITRCITSGRLPASCTGNMLLGAFGQMLSAVLPTGDSAAAPAAGPVMAGVFEGPGNWRLDFIDGGVLVNCAGLSPNQESYKLEFKDNRTSIVIATTPKPLILTFRPDGTIAGPGPVTINGVVAAGYSAGSSNSYSGGYKDQSGMTISDAQAASGAGPVYDRSGNRVSGPINTPSAHTNFARRTATCPALNLSSKGASVGMQTMQTDLLKTMFGGDKGPPTPPGIRMHGIFAAASTGFSVQFFPESAVLGCGPDVARAYPYQVVADGTKASVHISAPDHPLALAFKPDGSLDPEGSGPYQVHGRMIAGQNDNDDFTFAPREQTCNLAPLIASNTIPSSGGMPVASGPAGNVAVPSAPLGNATLSVISGFPAQPGTPNPLAGHPYVLLRDSYANALAKGGVSVPRGESPYKYVANACGPARTPDCQKIVDAIKADTASAIRADSNGSGTLPGVAPGTYYLMISGRFNNHSLVWGQAVQLKSGANSIVLDQRNATPID